MNNRKAETVRVVDSGDDPSIIEGMKRAKKDFLNNVISNGVPSLVELRTLVTTFYQIQSLRMRMVARAKALVANNPETPVLFNEWLAKQATIFENNIAKIIKRVTDTDDPLHAWLRSITGIGPVLAGGFLAYYTMDGTRYVSRMWAHAGLRPDARRKRGAKINYSPNFKQVCYKAAQSFVYQSNKPDCYYGRLFKVRKAYEHEKNIKGDYADQAFNILKTQNIVSDRYRKTLEAGRLSDALINLRAMRYTVKMFMSHLFEVYYWQLHKTLPPYPYALEHDRNADGTAKHHRIVLPPNLHLVPGLIEAKIKEQKERNNFNLTAAAFNKDGDGSRVDTTPEVPIEFVKELFYNPDDEPEGNVVTEPGDVLDDLDNL